jgi:PAS domain S-box
VAALLWAATTLVATNTFLGKFDAVDAQRVQLTLSRVRDAVQERQSQIANATKLWVLGEVATKQPSAASARGLLDTLDLNYVGLVDASGRLSNGFWRNVGTRNPDSFGSADEAMLAGLVAGLNRGESVSGIVETAFGPFLMAAQRLPAESPSGGIGAVAGVFLDSQFQENLQRTLLNDVEFLPPTESLRAMFSMAGADSMVPERGKDQSDVAAFGLLRDIKGAPALVFKVQEVRASYVAGNSNLRFFLGVTGAFGIIVVLLGTALVELLVTGRIRRLTVSAKRADQSGMDDLPRNLLHGGDEISALAKVTKSMVERLRASQLLYRTVVETQEELIARFKPDGTITFANEAFAQFFGRRAKGVIGRNLTEFFTKERIGEDILAGMPDAAHRSTERDLRVELEKGDVRWVQWTQRVIVGANKEAVEIQATGHDITLRMNYEMELQNARDAAEAADRSKSEFLAVMSHETRTPLTGILGFVTILQNTELTPDQQQYVSLIRSSGNSLLVLLNDLLDYSNVASGRIELRNATVEVGALAREIVTLHAESARAKDIDIDLDIELVVPRYIETDPTRLRQILNNLVGNAIKFTSKGFVRLSVGPVGRDQIEFRVKDTGIGIEPEGLGKLFKAFGGADTSNSRGHGGAGVGLAVCKRLVELMGGTIDVQSQRGLGSLFSVTLPVGNPEIPAGQEAGTTVSDAHSEDGEDDFSSHDLSVLVVEDNLVNQMVISRILKLLGVTCHVASSGEECLRMAQAREFDIIFMDVQMPDMDGFETVRQLRVLEAGAPNHRRAYVVACTAFTLPGDREKCFDSGMDNYIGKPVTKAAFARMIAYFLTHHAADRKKVTEFSHA